MDKDTSKPKKGSAKRYMQQRNNIHAAKNKLVNYVKETHIEPIKKDLAAPRAPRAKFGEGKLSTYLGLDSASLEDNRPSNLAHGMSEGRHVPAYLADYGQAQPEGVTHISKGIHIAAKRDAEKVLGQKIPDGDNNGR
jgi:hypothetical protein